MRSRATLAIVTWAVVELLLLGWVVSMWGLVTVVALSAAKAGLGVLLIGRSMSGVLSESLRRRVVPQRAYTALAGALLIIPGFLSGLAAALLVVPPIRAVLGSWLTSRIALFVPFGSWWPASGARPGPGAVDVDIVNEDTTTAPGGRKPAPGLR
ncbi:MAG: FxsA family protein [Acidimicrobiales bacterium]